MSIVFYIVLLILAFRLGSSIYTYNTKHQVEVATKIEREKINYLHHLRSQATTDRESQRQLEFNRAKESLDIAERDQRLAKSEKIIAELKLENQKLLEKAELEKPLHGSSATSITDDPRIIDSGEFVDEDTLVGVEADEEVIERS